MRLRKSLRLSCLIAGLSFLGSASAAPISYAITDSNQFGTLDLGSGNFNLIGTTADLLYGLVNTSAGLKAFTSTGVLVSINPLTGAETTIGDTGLGATSNVVATLNGTLFELGTNGVLYKIDQSTAAATAVGPVGIAPFDGNDSYSTSLTSLNGFLYYMLNDTTTNVGPSLYKIDPATGASQLIGATQGLVDAALFTGGTYYAVSNLNDPLGARIFSIDPATGKSTALANVGATGSIYGLADVPEPATMVLLGLGLAGLCLRRRLV